ncbi:MAG: hypothetical protein AAGF73_08375 [Actinomycetota bacterium]
MRTRDDHSVQRLVESPLFPFEGDLTVKPLRPLMHTEVVRESEGDNPCGSCDTPESVLWNNTR